MTDFPTINDRPRFLRLWPWLVLALLAVPAVWHVVDFPKDIDGEYPKVDRPTFNSRPPSSYRLAEPGDTIDRVALYATSAIVALALSAWVISRKADLWPVAIAAGLAAGWFASTPSPCYDGWHGLGWQAIAHPQSSWKLRSGLIAAAILLVGIVLVTCVKTDLRAAIRTGRDRRVLGLFVVSVILIAARAFDIPGVEPVGYWPRWAFSLGMVALGMVLLRLYPKAGLSGRMIATVASVGVAVLLTFVGLKITWLHRPLERLHAVVPGKIYISAMPTYRGLEVEQSRLHFKTIINLYPEDSQADRLTKRLPDELRFAREHGIRYVGSPGTALESDTFLDETLAIAQDPDAWPILVHCHGCMDRSPAWMGIYRFVVQDRPLVEILKEIEAHRGWRPKASVTLLYNRVLPARASKHYAGDPTAAILKNAAKGTRDPYNQAVESRTAVVNPEAANGVPRR